MRPWWLRLAVYARPHAGRLLLVLTLTLSGIGMNLLRPWPLKLLVDYALPANALPRSVAWISALPGAGVPTGLIAWLAGSTVVLFIMSESVAMAGRWVEIGLGSRMMYDLGATLFGHLQRLSLRYHGKQATGDLVRRVTTDSSCVRDLLLGVFLPLITSVGSLVAMLSVLWGLDRSLSLTAIAVAPLIAVLVRLFNRPMAERTYQHQQLEGQMMALTEQTLSALPVVKAFGREDYEERRFRGLAKQTLSAYLRALVSQLQFRVGVGSATALGTAAVMALGGIRVLQGTLTVGSLLVFLSYLASLYTPISTLGYLTEGVASAAGKARRVLTALDAEDQVREGPGARPLPVRPPGERGHVRLSGITFGFEPGQPVLKDVTLEARPGEVVALVGPTGAGKSTVAALIPRFYDPWEGRVTFDGRDVRGLRLASLRSQVAILFQEPFLLPISVAANIAQGRPSARRDEIVSAARAANADEFISRLPEGYDTVIGERGATLSGGEKQRLAIARALLKDAAVLILDEPTSALDVETEARLLEAVERLMAGRTTFIIAHRLSTIRHANSIVVLDDGRVVETGSHQELLAAGGLYHRLYSIQYGAAAARSHRAGREARGASRAEQPMSLRGADAAISTSPVEGGES